MRRALDTFLLVAGIALLITGVLTYPDVNGLVLLGMVMVGGALLAPRPVRRVVAAFGRTLGITR